jgi:ubiquitin C-terminal hydrolase
LSGGGGSGSSSSSSSITTAAKLAEKDPRLVPFDDRKINDPSYLKKYFTDLDSALTPTTENPVRLFFDLTAHLRLVDEQSDTIFADTLIHNHIVRLVTTVLERRYPVDEWRASAVEFLQFFVRLVVDLLTRNYGGSEALVRAMEKIFTRRFVFYEQHGWNDDTDVERPKFFPSSHAERGDGEPELFAEVKPDAARVSYNYLDLISCFCQAGGFDAVRARIADTEQQLGAAAASHMLGLAAMVRGHVRKAVLAALAPGLATVAIDYVNRFSDADLREQDLDDILDALNAVSKLAARTGLLDVAERIEDYKLALSVRCIQLPYLEARLKGIEQIKHIIQVAKGDARYHTRSRRQGASSKSSSSSSTMLGGASTWVTVDSASGQRSYRSASSSSSSSRAYRSDGSASDDDDASDTGGAASDGEPAAASSAALVVRNPLVDFAGHVSPPRPSAPFSAEAPPPLPPLPALSSPLDSSKASEASQNDDEEEEKGQLEEKVDSNDEEAKDEDNDVVVKVPEGQPPAPKGPPPSAAAAAPKQKERKGLAKLITVDFVLDWIKANNLIDIILGLEHEEALKQALVVVLFVAEHRGLADSTLESIWNAAKVHESHARVVYKHVSELLSHLPSAQIDWVYARIDELLPEEYNPQVLAFIGDFTREAIRVRKKRGEELKLYGLDLFWQTLMKASHARSSDGAQIVNETIEHLKGLLAEYPDQRESFLRRCIDNLARGDMVSVSLKLLRSIITGYKDDEVNELIAKLDADSSLLDSLLADLARRTGFEAPPPASDESGDGSAAAAAARAQLRRSIGSVKGRPSVESRLDFLRFLLTQSELMISEQQALKLWDSLAAADSDDERDFVYQWLEDVAFGYLRFDPFAYRGDKTVRFAAFTPAITEALFVERIVKLDFARFSLAGLRLFRRFFLTVNARQRRLRMLEETDIAVRRFDLVGIDQLWAIGLHTSNTTVALNALSMLRQLHANVSGSFARRNPGVNKQVEFADKCMQHLVEAVARAQQDGVDEQAQEQARRCLHMLVSVVSRENNTRHHSDIHGSSARILVPKMPKSLDDVRLPGETLPSASSSSSSSSQNNDDDKDKKDDAVVSDEEKARLEAERLALLGKKRAYVEQRAARRVEINRQDLEAARARAEAPSTRAYVGDMLTERYLSALFDAMACAELRDRVWKLVQQLPTPRALRAQIDELSVSSPVGAAQFIEALGPRDSPTYTYWLLYVLQLARSRSRDAEWRRRLVDVGAMRFLVEQFTGPQSIIDASAGPFGQLTMSHLVDVMRAVFESGAALDSIDSGFVHRIMAQLSSLAAQPPADASAAEASIDDYRADIEFMSLSGASTNSSSSTGASSSSSSSTASKAGTRFATTWYCSDKTDSAKILSFEILPKERINHFTAAVYCVDYNTDKRHQSVLAFFGDDPTIVSPVVTENPQRVELSSPSGPEFHNGVWIVYECHGEGPLNFQLKTLSGPNWVFPCVMLGPPRNPQALPNTFPSHVLDAKTQGSWRGRYGQWGGVILGQIDHRLPRPRNLADDTPMLGEFERPRDVLRFEWERGRLTDDRRALQLIPHVDQLGYLLDNDSDDDDEQEDEGADVEPVRVDEAAATQVDDDNSKLTPPPMVSEAKPLAAASSTTATSTTTPPPPAADAPVPPIEEEEEELAPTSTALLEMLTATVADNSALVEAMLAYDDVDGWLFDLLCRCADEKVRKAFVECLSKVDAGAARGALVGVFLKRLLLFLESIGSLRGEAASFSEYFELLQRLMDSAASSGVAVSYDKTSLISQLAVQLRSHQCTESDEGDAVDSAIVGLLDLLSSAIDGDDELRALASVECGLVDEVFGKCLFELPASRVEPQLPKCRKSESRAAAFRLLGTLIRGSAGIVVATLDRLAAFVNDVPLPQDWNIDVAAKKSEGASTTRGRYVGLKNQGCTCYLNSTLQQLYLIPMLRRAIMTVNVDVAASAEGGGDSDATSTAVASSAAGKGKGKSRAVRESMQRDNIMYQLQTLFAFMRESRQSFVDPLAFCRTVKLNGAPIAMARQEDANEFFNALAEQLEPYLKGAPQEHMFRDNLGGQFIHQIISKECEHRSERSEPFLTISVKVQNKRTLAESLDAFVKGDMLDGNSKYKCEQCDTGDGPRYVVANMRCCIEHLPNTLIVHLKRFEFCFESLQNIKINDRFEFPHELDMRPYTKEGLAEEEGAMLGGDEQRRADYYKYRLVGVLIHSGSANTGHYYSYIKERHYDDMASSAGGGADDEQRWYEFNDRSVTSFNVDSIAEKCFGGRHSESYRSSSDKHYSAYMLFYERDTAYAPCAYGAPLGPIGTVVSEAEQRAAEEAAAASADDIDPAILDRVWRDATADVQKRLLMSKESLDFVWQVIEQVPDDAWPPPMLECRPLRDEERTELPMRIVELASRYLFSIVSHCDNSHDVERKCEQLAAIVERHLPAAIDLLDALNSRWRRTDGSDDLLLRDLLVIIPDDNIRQAYAKFIARVLRFVAPYEHDFYAEQEDVVVPQEEEEEEEEEEEGDDGKKADDEGKEADDAASAPVTQKQPRSVCVRLIETIVMLLTASADKPADRIYNMLHILNDYSRISMLECAALIERDMVANLMSLYDKQRTISSSSGTWHNHQPRLQPLIGLLAQLTTACDNPHHFPVEVEQVDADAQVDDDDAQVDVDAAQVDVDAAQVDGDAATSKEHEDFVAYVMPRRTGLTLPETIVSKLLERSFLSNVMREFQYSGEMRRIVRHWCYGDAALSGNAIYVAGGGTDTMSSLEHRKGYFDLFADLLHIADAEQQWRIDTIMTNVCNYVRSNVGLENYRVPYLEFIFRMAANDPLVYRWLVDHDNLHTLFNTQPVIRQWIELHRLEFYVQIVSERKPVPPPRPPRPPRRTTPSVTAGEWLHDSDTGDDETDDGFSESDQPSADDGSPQEPATVEPLPSSPVDEQD